MTRRSWTSALLLVGLFATVSSAEDAFYRVEVKDLNITAGQLPAVAPDFQRVRLADSLQPYAHLEEVGEVYCELPQDRGVLDVARQVNEIVLAIRAPAGRGLKGMLVLPKGNLSGMVKLEFTIPATAADAKAMRGFYIAKHEHYDRLLRRQIPGAAWFRHQADEAAAAAEVAAGNAQPQAARPNANTLDDTFALVSGGRAISENLQLDRTLMLRGKEGDAVELSTLQGITVREMDWKALVKDLKPQVDPLAKFIPADQHAIFFPTFQAAVNLIDEADRDGTLVIGLLEPRSEDAMTTQRYQRQLGLSLTELGRVLGHKLVASVAVTGSDPYLRVGSDVAVLFQTQQPGVLRNLLQAQFILQKAVPNAAPAEGEIAGVKYSGFVSPGRIICSYTATLGDVVVVTNSLAQLQRLIEAEKGTAPNLASTPEYTFFRDRYKLTDADETALIVLSDATIRRWCSPRWRIADSRRTRAAAVLAELQVQNFDALASGTAKSGPIENPLGSDKLSLTPEGVISDPFGSLDFMTPIIEMPITSVTNIEAESYKRWRNSYQENWRQYFDPIAVRLTVQDKKLAADLTVMPLIAGSEYNDMMEISRGVSIGKTSGDPHNALLHAILSINKKSAPIRQIGDLGNVLGQDIKLDVLGWLGDSVSIYVDDDPFWQEVATAPDRDKFFQANLSRVPVALQAEVSSGLRLAAFLASVHAFVEIAAPQLTKWEPQLYKAQPYVRVSAHEGNQDLALYYVTLPDALVISPNEDLIKRAMDRSAERVKAKLLNRPLPPTTRPWLGSNFALQADARVAALLAGVFHDTYQQEMQVRAWANIPILNEWKRLYPDQDPAKLHERVWHTRLLDPAGGAYVWNAEYQTMESTTYAHPAVPKPGPALPSLLNTFSFGNFGLDFEDQGLRAKASLERRNP